MPFSLGTFSWASKRKYLAGGRESPHQIKPAPARRPYKEKQEKTFALEKRSYSGKPSNSNVISIAMKKLKTLPDYLRPGLNIVSIGLNPSLPSVRDGFYFANPRNRFWRALNASGLVPELLEPGIAATEILFHQYKIGFTDVVKRPTAGGNELRAADYREWAPLLKEKIEKNAPAVAWFHGKQAYANYLKYGEGVKPVIEWGEQSHCIGPARVFVTPNPSPANAAYSLAVLTDWFQQLETFRVSLKQQAE